MQAQVLNPTRRPTALLQNLTEQESAIRLWHIGGRDLFMLMLQRFRSEFPLARSRKIEGLDWLVFARSQCEAVLDFCSRYGLHIFWEE